MNFSSRINSLKKSINNRDSSRDGSLTTPSNQMSSAGLSNNSLSRQSNEQREEQSISSTSSKASPTRKGLFRVSNRSKSIEEETGSIIATGVFRKKGTPPMSNWKLRRFHISNNGHLYYTESKDDSLNAATSIKGYIFIGDVHLLDGNAENISSSNSKSHYGNVLCIARHSLQIAFTD